MKEIKPLLKSRGNKPRKGDVKKCAHCNKEFYVRPSERLTRKYCSFDCYKQVNVSTAKLQLKCKNCGKEFEQYKHRNHKNRFCSVACDKEYKTRQAQKPEARSHRRMMRSPKMRYLDNVFSKIIRTRDGKCLHCGTTQNLHCSHVLPRTYISVRWNLDNAIALCYRCHIYWWHKYPHDAVAWFDKLYPKRYGDILEIALKHQKINRTEELDRLKKIAKELNITI